MNCSHGLRRLLLAAVVVIGLGQTAIAAQRDEEIRLVAQLIWGTDGPKPPDAKIKEVDRETRGVLKGIFRWKNYFEVSRREFSVPAKGKRRVRMSDKCEIEVEYQGRLAVEVKLFGEGKPILTRRQVLKPGELLVIAGDDKDDTAWFVSISMARRERR
jgi:hypothetical protein